jgi:hypothetical protein
MPNSETDLVSDPDDPSVKVFVNCDSGESCASYLAIEENQRNLIRVLSEKEIAARNVPVSASQEQSILAVCSRLSTNLLP